MLHCFERAFDTAWGEKKGKKKKQTKIKTATQAKDIQLNKEESELICEAFFFPFLRKNIGDFCFQAAPIC